jgi:hypothetical protein
MSPWCRRAGGVFGDALVVAVDLPVAENEKYNLDTSRQEIEKCAGNAHRPVIAQAGAR